MKKTCLFLLLAINVISVSCMEKERPNNNTLITQRPHIINSPYTWQPPFCEANQPGWQQLDKIANMTYKDTPSTPMDEVELKPIYKPAKTTIMQQEHKSLLQTNSLQPNNNIMESLYESGRDILIVEYRGTKNQIIYNQRFVGLIEDMANAKNNGIHEDLMGQFSHQKHHAYLVMKDIDEQSEKNITPLVPLLFILLKKYNTTIQHTGEKVPLHFKKETPYLKKTLRSPIQIYQETIFNNVTNVYDDIKQYPAFFQFMYAVRRTIQNLPDPAITTFITYIYDNLDMLSKDYADIPCKDFKEKFYIHAYNTLDNGDGKDFYSLIHMIDQAKRLGYITDEDDLITHMTDYFATDESIATKIYRLLNSSHSIDNVIKKLTLFCKLIKQYNTTKHYKITPTIAQQRIYCVKTFLDISLPEHLCNNTHLDDTVYAFKEYKQLNNDTATLVELTSDQINELYESLTQ